MPKNKGKILIIEDDEFLRSLCVRKLRGAGFKVSVAVDGEEGLKKVKEEKPALILLDIVLPGIDGFEVLKRLKEDRTMADIPVVCLTNLGQEPEVKKGLELGANDYLVKAHIVPEEIVEKVEHLIFKKRGK